MCARPVTVEQVSRVLQKLIVQVVPNTFCRIYRKISMNQRKMCAGGVKGQGGCRGDSGGPLVGAYSFGGPGRFFLTGIVFAGPKYCGDLNQPSVYTKVAEYMDWILDTVRP